MLAAAGLGGFEANEEENAWWEARMDPVEAAVEAGDLERAEDLRLEVWAPMGTDDAAGRRIREIAFDNIHELTMDESAEEELEPPAALRLGEIDVPTLVMVAEHDPPFMRRCDELIGREVLDGRLVEDGCRSRRQRAQPRSVRRRGPAVPGRVRALSAFATPTSCGLPRGSSGSRR